MLWLIWTPWYTLNSLWQKTAHMNKTTNKNKVSDHSMPSSQHTHSQSGFLTQHLWFEIKCCFYLRIKGTWAISDQIFLKCNYLIHEQSMMLRETSDSSPIASGYILPVFTFIYGFRYKLWNIFAIQHLKTVTVKRQKINNKEQSPGVLGLRGYGYNPYQPNMQNHITDHKLGLKQI